MQTVQQRWERFERDMVPAGASPAQRQVLRRAFYAGFYESLGAITDVSQQVPDEEQAVGQIEAYYRECREYIKGELSELEKTLR